MRANVGQIQDMILQYMPIPVDFPIKLIRIKAGIAYHM